MFMYIPFESNGINIKETKFNIKRDFEIHNLCTVKDKSNEPMTFIIYKKFYMLKKKIRKKESNVTRINDNANNQTVLHFICCIPEC